MLYTNDNLIGHSIYHYLIDSHENATRLSYADVIHEKHLPLAQTIIFNLINKDISAIRIVDLLNALRLSLLRCQQTGANGEKRHCRAVQRVDKL